MILVILRWCAFLTVITVGAAVAATATPGPKNQFTTATAAAAPTPTPAPAVSCVVLQTSADTSKAAADKIESNRFTAISTGIWAVMWIIIAWIARGVVFKVVELPDHRKL